jgi:hypothetical protein
MNSSINKQEKEQVDQVLLDCPLLFDCKAMTGAIASCCNYFACWASSSALPSTNSRPPFRLSPGSLVVTDDRFDQGWAIATKFPYEYSCKQRVLTVLTTLESDQSWAIATKLPYEYSCKQRVLTVLTTLESEGYYTATAFFLPAKRKKVTLPASGVQDTEIIEALIVSDSAELGVCSEMVEGGWHKPVSLYPRWSDLCRGIKIFTEDNVVKKAIEFHNLDVFDYDCYIESIYHSGRTNDLERQLYAVVHWVIFEREDDDLDELIHFTGSFVLETKTPVNRAYFSKTHCQLSSFQPHPSLKVNSFHSEPPDWLNPDEEFFPLY